MTSNVTYEYKSAPVSIQRQQKHLGMTPHLHKEIEIVYVEKGRTLAFSDRNRYDMSEGDLFINFPNQIHHYRSEYDSIYDVFIVIPELFYGKNDLFFSSLPQSNVIHLSKNDKALKYVKKLYSKELYTANDISAYTGYFNLLFSEILPRLTLTPIITTEHSTMHNILKFCTRHYRENLTLDTVAQGLHLNRCYISHIFSDTLNIGFNNYVNMLRVNEACTLLTETDARISDISEEVGFGSVRSFNRAFLHTTGKTPNEYRTAFLK